MEITNSILKKAIKEYRDGDEKYFLLLLDEMIESIFKKFYFYCKEDREDTKQNILMKVISREENIDLDKNIFSYLITIMHNVLYDQQRKLNQVSNIDKHTIYIDDLENKNNGFDL